MSLAAQTLTTANNWNAALTLAWFVGVLEKCTERFDPKTALDMIHEHLASLETERIKLVNEPRVKAELADNPQLAEVVT